jgi:hypothetical protein
MLVFRSPLVRIAATALLLGLIGFSGMSIKNIATVTWQSDQQEEALYKRSPNCFPHRDPSEVDQSLSPCQDVTATVIAKPQNTVINHYRSRDYPKTHLLLTLQYANGQTQTVGDIYTDMWQSLKIGDQVSVTVWRSQVRDVAANGYSSIIVDEKKWNRAFASLWPWGITIVLCSLLIGLLWKFGRERMELPSFLT